MIRNQILCRGIRDLRVIRAMVRTDRGLFVPPEQQELAYSDQAVPLFPGASVSQPIIVALMTDLLCVRRTDRVLEVGTGSGYQAVVLSHLAAEVWTVEVRQLLAQYAQTRIDLAGRKNIHVICSDGWNGVAEVSPFDRILVTAAPGTVPRALLRQLAPGGRMVVPVGSGAVQTLEVIKKSESGEISCRKDSMVQFVPLVRASEENT